MANPQQTGFSSSGPDRRCRTDCLGRLGIPTLLAGMLGGLCGVLTTWCAVCIAGMLGAGVFGTEACYGWRIPRWWPF